MAKVTAQLFETALGRCGMMWTSRGICTIVLAEKDDKSTLDRLTSEAGFENVVVNDAAQRPDFVDHAQRLIRAHLAGNPDSLRTIPVDFLSVSPFARDVYQALRKVNPGSVVTYSELARMSHHDGAARAVGRAMAKNPLPLVVPCHRVLGADGRLGGFSAYGGPGTKAKLLYLEGVVLNHEHDMGMELVKRAEPALAETMLQVGPYLPTLGRALGAYDALVQSVVYQQLSMKAASTIAARLRLLGQNGHYPDPEQFLLLEQHSLRACGLSRQKISYLKDLAQHVLDGRLRLGRLGRMSDEEVLGALREVKGFGIWSAQMFLIFHLKRLDVWPTGDLGLRRAIGHLTGLDPADSEALFEYGNKFRPFRSIATWYLWRYEELQGTRKF